MNKAVLIGIFALFTFSLSGQDLIIKTNNDTIHCVVVDVSYQFVKCITWPDREGPVYNILKKDVLKIKYENGEELIIQSETGELIDDINTNDSLYYKSGFTGLTVWQGDKKLHPTDVKILFKSNEEALSNYKSGRSMKTVATVVGLPSGFILGWQLGTMLAGGDPNGTMAIIGAGGVIASVVLDIMGGNKIRRAISIYNASLNETISFQIKVGLTEHGMGIVAQF